MTRCESCGFEYDGPEDYVGLHIGHLHVEIERLRGAIEDECRAIEASVSYAPGSPERDAFVNGIRTVAGHLRRVLVGKRRGGA